MVYRHRSKMNRICLHKKHKNQKGKCFWCNEDVPLRKATRDHVIPLGRGGKNSFSNIVMSCRECNAAKANLDPKPLLWLRFVMGLELL